MSFNKWDTVKLKDIGEIVTGKTPSTKIEGYYDGKYLFITPRDMNGSKKIENTERTLSEYGINSVSKQILNSKSICVSCIGSDMGKVIISNGIGVTNQQINSITNIKDDYDIDFVYYTLKQMKEYLHSIAGGSTMPIVNKSTFEEIEVKIPKLKEQKVIAKILSDLDDKIEVNNKINKKLEEMAQSIFKHWFVDFEFPNEEGQPYKSSGGKMVDSELGMIPNGWQVKQVDEVCNVSIGKTPPRKEQHWFSQSNNDVKWISIKDLGNCGTYIFNTAEYLTREAVNKFNIKIVPKDTVILSFKMTIGRIAITTEEMLTNEAIAHFVINNQNKITKEYLYSYLNNFNYEILGSTSSIATAINSKIVKKIPIIIPIEEVLNNFTRKIDVIFKLIRKNELENIKLANLRDTLLPKLMSGEIRVALDK